MKKLFSLFVAFTIAGYSAFSAPISSGTAQSVATNFFSQVSTVSITNVTLAYTETDAANNAVYYVFNINAKDGFVIVSADDAQRPIIGYSTEKRPYVVPVKGTNADFWMQKRKTEIISNVTNRIAATPEITKQWVSYINNTVPPNVGNVQRVMGVTFPSNSAFLVQSTWDQPSPYNDDCPGVGANKAVTGCVATTMCQIMRYWQYPPVGQSNYSYYMPGYGTLSAKFNHPYPWSTMPLTNVSVTDTALARAMSDAGVSVDMWYSPTGSGAQVITADGPICAQTAYVQYFKYSNAILDGLNEFNNLTNWEDTLKHELDRGRPIQYVGSDPSAGGHTWVCDGYDAGNLFHMNWGWSGQSDGWYALGNLNPIGFNFSQNNEALIGIMPPTVSSKPVASFTSSTKTGCTNNNVLFMDVSSNQPHAWNWTFTGGTPATSNLQNPTVTYNTPGNYAVKLVVTNGFGIDSVSTVNYITVNAGPAAPTATQNGSLLTATPSNYPTYQWYKKDNNGNFAPIAGATSYQLWISQKGIYEVSAINASGCSNTSGPLGVVALGINEISIDNNISVYPNPTSGNVKVDFNLSEGGDYNLAISNVLGQTVYTDNVHLSGSDTRNLNMANYGKGVYFLAITGNNSRAVKKIIVY